MADRDNLWAILHRLTRNKAADYFDRENAAKRGGGRVVAECELSNPAGAASAFSLDHLEGNAPPPAYLVEMRANLDNLLDQLSDDILRQIALAKLESRQNDEIATRLGISKRSVERKLQLIRLEWKSQLQGF